MNPPAPSPGAPPARQSAALPGAPAARRPAREARMQSRADGGGVIRRYREWLPVPDGAPVISLGEGSTPLIPAPVLAEKTGCEVYLKVEGANPTGSFKDRGMTVAVSMAAAHGAQAVICASTGNTSASAAAYAARGGMACAVLVPRGKIALCILMMRLPPRSTLFPYTTPV